MVISESMTGLLIRWLISIAALLVVAHTVPGISVTGTQAILVAPILIGLVNATLGAILKLLSFPITILTLGLSSLVINALMLMLVARIVDGFRVDGFAAAFFGSILLSLTNWVLRLFFSRSGD